MSIRQPRLRGPIFTDPTNDIYKRETQEDAYFLEILDSLKGSPEGMIAKRSRNVLKAFLLPRTDNRRGIFFQRDKPLASEVLTNYLLQTREPPWTSYFVKYADVVNDQRGMSHFNWSVANSNYHVLRTGCFPYIKYHCTRRPRQDLSTDDKFFKAIKILNLGIPTLMYGLAATFLIRHREIVKTPRGDITIYFLLPEDKGSLY
ncbi:hypothetical protein HZH66_011108 [Vespula vulgaris]|uniref:Uncharacterized protein n=1 Tax=Vespula vulgaris TaxID=7454 RepID=A0A834JJL5_VESVU|nr:hypothetical protein HZH66_011108 [Vespula vulgaris]